MSPLAQRPVPKLPVIRVHLRWPLNRSELVGIAGQRAFMGPRQCPAPQVICVVRWLPPAGHGVFCRSGPALQPVERLLQESERLGV